MATPLVRQEKVIIIDIELYHIKSSLLVSQRAQMKTFFLLSSNIRSAVSILVNNSDQS